MRWAALAFFYALGGRCGPLNSLQRRIKNACQRAAMSAAPLIGPKPAAMMLARSYGGRWAELAARTERLVAPGVVSLMDHRYGPGEDERLDVHRPGAGGEALPIVVWVHGGGWLMGTKEESAPYMRLLAGHGYAVVAPHYSLAPRHLHPTPTRQIMLALGYLQDNAAELGVDPGRIALAGDSSGAHVAAQVAAIVTTPGYAERLGVAPAIAPGQLRGLVAAGGIYDVSLIRPGQPGFSRIFEITMWAYAGSRHYAAEPYAAMSVADYLTSAFPPVLITVGNADALAPQSHRFAQRLRAAGRDPELVLFADDHEPPIGHNYQFDSETAAGRAFLSALLRFLSAHLGGRTG